MKELNYCLTEMGMTTEGATTLMRQISGGQFWVY